MEEEPWTTDELLSRLYDCESGQKVQATTPHGTYLFNIQDVEDTLEGGVMLRLKAVK